MAPTTRDLPLLIPSYRRPLAPLPQLAKQVLGKDYPWYVVVRKSQYRDYSEFIPKDNLVYASDSKLKDLGTTRNWILRWSRKNGFNRIFDWDDDVKRFGIKLPDGTRHESYKATGNTNPWFNTPQYFKEASNLANQVFDLHPGTVVGSIQNQRWAKTATVMVQHGKTPRRTKIVEVDRILDNDLVCPPEFRFHGEDIGNTALYLQYGWEVFTLCNLVYDFVPETDKDLPSTLRHRDELRNRELHLQEYASLQQYDIRNYLRVNKSYDNGDYMYGDIDWRKFRKFTGQTSYTYEYRHVLDHIPLSKIPVESKVA